jgi:hypothetical protein
MSFNARVSYTADGNTSTFAITFSFIDSTHVKVFLDGVSTTAFTISGSNVVMNSNPANSTVVLIKRETPTDARLVDFQDGSVLTESDLDKSADQNFFIAQEINDESQSAMKLATDDTFDALNKRIKNVADPVNNNDAVNKGFISTNLANINTVAGISSQVTNVANSLSAITTANSNSTNINTVATNIASVNTVATNITDVQKVAQDLNEAVSEIETVADDLNEASSEIDTVAQNIASVNSVAGNSTNINTVAGAITNVNNVGGSIANVNTVAGNLTSVNAFGSTYKISATAPTGIPEGTLWFDTTNDVMKVYDGNAFQNAGSSVNGTSQRNKFTATANQTVFTGNDDNSVALAYDPNFLDVYLNGVRIINGASNDYTATDGSTITLNSGASAGDILSVVSFGTFSIASFSATAITSDTLPIARGGTGISSVSGQADKVLKVNSSGNAFILGQASSPEVYGFTKSFTASTIIYTVTVQSVGGQNKYFINGEQQKTLELLEGNTYIFNYPSAHPFKFSTTSNGTHGGGTEYTTGVTHNSSTQVTIVVGTSAPTLYYYCSSHSAMGGQANTPVPANNTLQVITTNQGADNITNTQYNSFDDVLFSASGYTFSIDATTGNLIATI